MYDNILVPIDLNEESSWRKALPTAITLCHAFDAKLHVVTVVPDYGMTVLGQYFPPDAEQAMTEKTWRELKALCAKEVPSDLKVHHLVLKGTIYQRIIEAGAQVKADLIVMASHRPELADYLIGPNAAKVVRHYERSVLVVRP
jgi:nucleotide-binding universal stress UspA family protein